MFFRGLFLLLFMSGSLFAQKSKFALPKELHEISGLAVYNDSVLFAHNDGGDDPRIYVLSLKGKLLHTCLISNVKNNDWEDIELDEFGNLFIADFGNNNNNRENLQILKVNASNILKNDTIVSQIISINYPNQKKHPPLKQNKSFDAESLIYHDQSLFIFSKCNSNPYNGISYVYKIPVCDGCLKKVTLFDSIVPGKRGWIVDSFTAGTYFNGLYYLSTYNRLIGYHLTESSFKQEFKKVYPKFNQKEAIAFASNGDLYVANEKHKILGTAKLKIFRNINKNDD